METKLLLVAALTLFLYAQLAIAFMNVTGAKVSWKKALIAFFIWPVFRPLKCIEYLLCMPYIAFEHYGDADQKSKR